MEFFRTLDIEPGLAEGFDIAQVKGLDAGVCGAELRLPQRHWSCRRLRAAASAWRQIASEQAGR